MSTTNIDKAAAAGNSLITVAATNDTDIYTTAIVAGSFGINIINFPFRFMACRSGFA